MTETVSAGGTAATDGYATARRAIRPALTLAASFSALVNILMLTGSVYMLQVYDRVLASGSLPTLVGLFLVVTLLYIFLAYYDFLRSRILSRSAARLDQMVGETAFRAWLREGLDPARAESQPLRELEMVRGFLASPAMHGIFDLPWIPFYLLVLYLVHPWLCWLTIGGALVVMALAAINRALSKPAFAHAAVLDGNERRFTDRSQSLAAALLPMGMERALTERWRSLHLATLAGSQKGSGASEGLAATSRAFRMFLQSATLTVGAVLVLRGEMSGGMIVAATIISGRALAPLDSVIGHWRTIGRAIEADRRLSAFFAGEARRPATVAVDLPAPSGRIEVTDLSKHAPRRLSGTQQGPAGNPILSQVSFALDPGDGLGVIGNSASGKSTLARLLVGSWRPDSGEIRLDGATLDQWHPERLGRSIGYLPQNVDLLHGTVRENIARFDPQAKSDDIIEAARQAGVHDMILALPDGYATQVGGPDTPLSGGQIQRLGLARALYGAPSIVVLDEPNANLDAEGDAALTNAIAGLRASGATVVVMAHRPSALAAVNKVLVLQAGALVAFGPKEDVLGVQPGEAARLTAATAEADAGMAPETGGASHKTDGVVQLDRAASRNLLRSRHPVFSRWRA
ncbi:MAG: type I secretion system permease/ATPase [Proteobacteria bacterium]|nr:type I secretion system permease/ATPase [Pseudomonadota bacterium]MBS0573060.1 type I secretion system permease/ATPase [Pseudomonadota bacterium]